jgi:hypothetical protein
MFDTRALQLEVVKKPNATGEPVVVAHIYADDDNSPVAQVWGIPLSRIRVLVKAELGSPYCSGNWSLKELMDAADLRRAVERDLKG